MKEAAEISLTQDQAALCGRSLCAKEKQLQTEKIEHAKTRQALRNAKNQLKKLERLLRTDPLTGLPNRRALSEDLKQLIKEIIEAPQRTQFAFGDKTGQRKPPQYLAAMIIDLDHFKAVNDRYSHLTGDNVLKIVAKTLRKTDMFYKGRAARFGGEEMVVVFRCAEQSDAIFLAEKVRKELEVLNHKVSGTGISFPVTASIGVTALHNSLVRKYKVAKTQKELFTLADVALYAAKVNGRNRVCFVDWEGELACNPVLQSPKTTLPKAARPTACNVCHRKSAPAS
ncbi:MAG: GGDEF domain-containing protein [Alphaproteobacteria bacterium]|nr:GGDEF domain-containing protein [Alphaproteobacteria bacterium]